MKFLVLFVDSVVFSHSNNLLWWLCLLFTC